MQIYNIFEHKEHFTLIILGVFLNFITFKNYFSILTFD
jgi:hypothetical protein